MAGREDGFTLTVKPLRTDEVVVRSNTRSDADRFVEEPGNVGFVKQIRLGEKSRQLCVARLNDLVASTVRAQLLRTN
jgi:hypothetical protein